MRLTDIKAGDELVYDYGHEDGELTGYYGIPADALAANVTLD